MAYWAALLKGINVGGRNKLAMADLRDLCSDLGLTDVSTYINSGNILFACDSVDGLVPRLEAEITKRFGLEIPIVVCSAERLESALAANPFAGEDPTKVLVYFCSRAVSPASASKIDGARSPDDSIAVLGTEVYLHLPDGVHKTKLTLGYLEKTLGVTMTSRNINTVEKLCSLNN